MPKLTQDTLAEWRRQLNAAASQNRRGWIKIGMSTCGVAAGARRVYQRCAEEIQQQNLPLRLLKTGCVGMCYAEPLVEIDVDGGPRAMYGGVREEDVAPLLERHVRNKQVLERLQVAGIEQLGFRELTSGATATGPEDRQFRIVTRNCGLIDPESIEDYIAGGGYLGLCRALFELGPEGVIEELRKSGLRGRGGAGYPTWKKWRFLRDAPGDEKYMICNGDEGDPGAYMDRSVMEGDPHSLIEGMAIAGFAMGAAQGFFYIRSEYPLAIERIENAILQAKRNGLLGKNVLGSDFSYSLEIRLGAGAFVCGEETALMASVEGQRGTPRPRPPFPAERGLWGRPSNINNVETLANIPPIMTLGGDWFAAIGTPESTGTKVFAVTGKIARSGLIEIPMGTTIADIVYGICGGGLNGRAIKAIQTGGPSGGVIPRRYFATPVSYESLRELGSIMGSGGMIVMDEADSMVDIARFYLGFCVDESCGKCAPCRIGGKQLLLILERIAQGEGRVNDLQTLRKIARAMQHASLCGLGQTAANPVLSTLRYYEDEYTRSLN